jgi:hypothetical protein
MGIRQHGILPSRGYQHATQNHPVGDSGETMDQSLSKETSLHGESGIFKQETA